MSDAAVPRRGRPPATTRAHVARTALRLFVEDGYEATTMQDVAAAVGITRRSLFRYFDTKAAILWHGADEAAGSVLAALGDLEPGPDWRSGVARAVLAALRFPDDDVDALRLRLQLIEAVPALRSHLTVAGAEATTALTRFIATSTGAGPHDLEPLVLGQAVWTTNTTALLWWAGSPDAGTAHDAVARALAALGFPA